MPVVLFEKCKKMTVRPDHIADSSTIDEKVAVSKDWSRAIGIWAVLLTVALVAWCTFHYHNELSTSTAEQHPWAISRLIGDGANADALRGAPNTWWWSFLPFTKARLQKTVISFHQDQLNRIMGDRWGSAEAHEDDEGDAMTRPATARILPAGHPTDCGTDEKLPPLNTVYNQMFRRRGDGNGLVRDPKRRNLLLHTFYQYFVLQFFDEGFSATVTGSQLYGADEETRKGLRSFTHGKLNAEYLNGEEYPPRRSFAEKIKSLFTRMESFGQPSWFNSVSTDDIRNPLISTVTAIYNTLKPQWAVAHPLLSTNPLLFVMSTLWLREHNRVCDELVNRWPAWTDDQVYAVAKKTVVGEMMVIMINEVMTNINPFSLEHDPKMYPDLDPSIYNCSFATPLELLLTTILPSGLPEELDDVKLMEPNFIDYNSQVSGSGVSEIVRLMVDQEMGQITSNNDGTVTRPLTKILMKLSRNNAVQSFNNYRRHFGLHAYNSFYELTGNRETASKLHSLYGDVEKVELLTGLLTEKKCDDFVPTFTVLVDALAGLKHKRNSGLRQTVHALVQYLS